MWIDYKEVENLITAEMWKSLLEGEGCVCVVLMSVFLYLCNYPCWYECKYVCNFYVSMYVGLYI